MKPCHVYCTPYQRFPYGMLSPFLAARAPMTWSSIGLRAKNRSRVAKASKAGV